MRFIKGDSLKDAIAAFHGDETLSRQPGRRSLELRKLLRRLLDVCNAIEFAHSRGVLHRDLKPSNVILGKHGETLVVDWGLAKALGRIDSSSGTDERPLVPSSASGSPETLPGSALGTPAYMSPEQAVGDLDRLGPRSDVYSLGATLYCLLTGKPPFGGEIGDVLRAVQKGDFRPPRALDRDDRPGARGGLLEGDGTGSPMTAMARRRRWPTRSSGGWPTSRSRLTASRHRRGWRGGDGGTSRSSPARPPS